MCVYSSPFDFIVTVSFHFMLWCHLNLFHCDIQQVLFYYFLFSFSGLFLFFLSLCWECCTIMLWYLLRNSKTSTCQVCKGVWDIKCCEWTGVVTIIPAGSDVYVRRFEQIHSSALFWLLWTVMLNATLVLPDTYLPLLVTRCVSLTLSILVHTTNCDGTKSSFSDLLYLKTCF